MAHPNERLAAVQDVMAAEVLAAAAKSDAGARDLVDAVNDALTTSYIHRMRVDRLNGAAVRATMAGSHNVAQLLGRFAGQEAEAADEFEAVGVATIRGTHSFGYLSEAERRFLSRKKFEEGLSTAQAEDVFSKLLDGMMTSASNYGRDEAFGAGDAEPEEVDNGAIESMGLVAEVLGGDLPIVFGANAYSAFYDAFGASVETLKKRRSRVKARLEKNKEKLEEIESSGKGGARAKWFRMRVKQLTKRLKAIEAKLAKLSDTKDKVDESSEEAAVVDAAETSAVQAAAKAGEADSELDELENDLSALDGEDPEEEEEEDEEAEEYGMVAEMGVFGISERRMDRMRERLDRLKERLEKLQARHRGLLKAVRVRRLQKRIARLESKLQAADAPEAIAPSTVPYVSSFVTPTMKAFSQDEYLASYKGSLNETPEIADRQPFVQFFRRKVDALGSLAVDPEYAQAENAGFFSRLGGWLREHVVEPVEGLFTPDKVARRQARRSERRQKIRSYMKEQSERLRAGRAAARQARLEAKKELDVAGKRRQAREEAKEARQSGRELRRSQLQVAARGLKAKRAGRKAAGGGGGEGGGEAASPMVPDGVYEDGQYIYRVAGGLPYIVKNKAERRDYASNPDLKKGDIQGVGRPIPRVAEALEAIASRSSRVG